MQMCARVFWLHGSRARVASQSLHQHWPCLSHLSYLTQHHRLHSLAHARPPSVPATLFQQLRIWGQGLGFRCSVGAFFTPSHVLTHHFSHSFRCYGALSTFLLDAAAGPAITLLNRWTLSTLQFPFPYALAAHGLVCSALYDYCIRTGGDVRFCASSCWKADS